MSKRQDLILQQINSVGKVNINQLAQSLSVSIETIRRDLTKMENKGLIHRIHGGAVSRNLKDIGSSFQSRQRANYDAKQLIAQKAIEFVFEGAIIGLDASSSSWHFTQLMPNIPCTVVTNSMHNVTALTDKPLVKTIVTGGVYSRKYDSFYGPLSEYLFSRLHLDLSIISCTGIDNSGAIWESNELNASSKRKMMEATNRKFLLADSSKFQRTNLIKLADLSQIDILFTEQSPPEMLCDYCHSHQVELVLA